MQDQFDGDRDQAHQGNRHLGRIPWPYRRGADHFRRRPAGAPLGTSNTVQHPLVLHALRCTVTEDEGGGWIIHACRRSDQSPYSVSVRARDNGTVVYEQNGPASHSVTQPTPEFHADGKTFVTDTDPSKNT